MSRSFFTWTNDAELSMGSKAFSEQISASPEAYGLTSEMAEAYAARHAVFAQAVLAIGNRGTKTSAMVAGKNDARRALVEMASKLGKIISGTPSVTDAQRVNLGLSVRKARSPIGPPGVPFEFKNTLGARGDVEISWKCDNPRGSTGTIYRIFRKDDRESGFVFIGTAGRRKFVDSTLMAGAKRVAYRIQAIRSTKTGDWAEFVVQFGRENPTANTEMQCGGTDAQARIAA